jgi:hypothetical protein
MPSLLQAGELRGTIRAVVHKGPVSIYPGSFPWNRRIVFTPVVWRHEGGPVRKETIFVYRHVMVGTANLWRARLRPESLIAFESAGIEVMDKGGRRLRMTRLLGEPSDPELEAAAAAIFAPLVIKTKEFGRLTGVAGEVEGRCDWHGTSVTLELVGDADGEMAGVLAHARNLYAGWPAWEAQLSALVTREILPLWIDWNPDEPPIDGDTLYRRLTLKSVWVAADGELRLALDAGDEFIDHEIAIDGTVGGGPASFDLEG